MPELTPQEEAQQIAALSAWVLRAQEFRQMLSDAGCTDNEARYEVGVVSVKLECGHRIGFQFPDALPCPPCSNEVEALKKMAGAK